MNEVLEEVYRTGEATDAQGRRRLLGPTPVPAATGRLLYEHVRAARPRRTLEVGLAHGLSALFVCQAHRDAGRAADEPVHTAIDPYQSESYGGTGIANLERAGLGGMVRFFEERSDAVLPRLAAAGERLDFAFVDGSHLFDHILVDFYYLDLLLEPGGVLAFDDLWLPAVRKVASYALRNRAYELLRPPEAPRVPLHTRTLRLARRVLQNPFGRDWALKLVPENVVFLRKTRDDDRDWRFHRQF